MRIPAYYRMDAKIDFAQFRQLLQAIENADTTIRLRTLGNPWTTFCNLILLSESAMILKDDTERKIIMNLKNVVEFEVSAPVADVKANHVYEVSY